MAGNKMYRNGHFSASGDEFVITNPNTARAFDNFIWNDSAFSCVQQTGVGYFDYQVGDTEGIKLFTGIGRICDFDVFGRDGLMSRLVYVRDNATGEYWNLNWEPVKKEYEEYSCTHGLGYTIIRNRTADLESSLRIFIPEGGDPVELWTLTFQNLAPKSRDVSIFVYCQFSFKYKWGFNSYGDMIFRGSSFNRDTNTFLAEKHPHIKPHDHLIGFMAPDVPIDGFDGSRDRFVGMYNTLNEPVAVIKGSCTGSDSASDSTVGALQFNLSLAQGENRTIDCVVGASDSEENAASLKSKYLGQFDRYFSELKASKQALVAKDVFTTPDRLLDTTINIWTKQQNLYGARWCRWGWNGYRDIVQHGMGVVSHSPARTREIILEAMTYKYSNGLALRGWNPVDEKAYSDSALWLIYTVTAYLKETGDLALLDLVVPYYDKGEDTVMAHLEAALSFLDRNRGAHDLCLIKFGDWNDSLTAIGKEGRGESVWLSMAYARALGETIELCRFLGQSEKADAYAGRRENMISAINTHAWDGDWYIRCFDDQGRPVGSKENEQGKIFLNAQSWSMICGAATPEKAGKVLAACDEMLLTDMGYQLLTPTFLKYDPHIGRISALEPGVAENGTIYSHGNVFMMWALLLYGMGDKAYDTFKRITPCYVSGETDPKHNCPPYIYTNGYYGPEHGNNKYQMEYTWMTGSVPWFYRAVVSYMLGVRPEYDGLVINPVLPSAWKEPVTMTKEFRGKRFDITISGSSAAGTEIRVNGTRIKGLKIDIGDCGTENRVEVVAGQA